MAGRTDQSTSSPGSDDVWWKWCHVRDGSLVSRRLLAAEPFSPAPRVDIVLFELTVYAPVLYCTVQNIWQIFRFSALSFHLSGLSERRGSAWVLSSSTRVPASRRPARTQIRLLARIVKTFLIIYMVFTLKNVDFRLVLVDSEHPRLVVRRL